MVNEASRKNGTLYLILGEFLSSALNLILYDYPYPIALKEEDRRMFATQRTFSDVPVLVRSIYHGQYIESAFYLLVSEEHLAQGV